MSLTEEIKQLIELKHEGGYWDFKLEWYERPKQECNMLHDIICFANNLENRDAYIIIGVKNSTWTIEGVENDDKRMTTQQITDFLKNKKFAGDYRPFVRVENVMIDGKLIDVIIIENSTKTPYFLKEKFQELNPGHIYTRIQDTNTPTCSSADFDKVEYLWKKRFGLDSTILEKFEIALNDSKNWFKDMGNKRYLYSKIFPEYHIELGEPEEIDCDPIKCFYTNPNAFEYKAKCYFNNTLIYETTIWAVDESRKHIVKPAMCSINKGIDKIQRCYYYNLDDLDGKILKVICPTLDFKSREIHDIPIIVFENEIEKEKFISCSKDEFFTTLDCSEYDEEIKKDNDFSYCRLGCCAKEIVESYKAFIAWKKQITK